MEAIMLNVIKQSVTLAAPVKALHAMYLNPKTHRAITGAKVVITAHRGGALSPRCARLRSITAGSSITAMIFRRLPHCVQLSISIDGKQSWLPVSWLECAL